MRRPRRPSQRVGGCGTLSAAVAIAAVLQLGPASATAQDMAGFKPGPDDRADAPADGYDALYSVGNTRPAIEACLAAKTKEKRSREECLGLTMDVCLSFKINETTLGSIRCAGGEGDAWEALMGETLDSVAAKGDAGLRKAVEDSQQAWEAHRSAKCRIWGEVFRGGSLARQIGADCMRDSAGRRALDLLAVEEALAP